MKSRALAIAAVAGLAFGGASSATADPHPRSPAPPSTAQLTARSTLPAATYTPRSAPSGHWTTGNEVIPAPYPGQPVQGFSGTHRLGDGSYLVMGDNGFGSKANSADALLAVHRIRPDAASGRTEFISTVFTLSDPDGLVPWQLWRDGACQQEPTLPAGYTCPAPDRALTGWDFDPESIQVAPDGTFWFGEEFGPYLLHTDAQGRLLAPPLPTPGVASPSNPTLTPGHQPNLANSKGFEGMAISPDGRTLYPMLEGALDQDKATGRAEDLRIFQVRTGTNGARFTGGYWRYRMEHPDHAIGDLIAVNATQFLVIERDNGHGPEARFKRIYLLDSHGVANQGYVRKTLLVDLMRVPDPDGVGGLGDPFAFPYFTIEDVEIIDPHTIAVMNDNNFPATDGRVGGQPDGNEYIEIRLARPLDVDPRLLPRFIPYNGVAEHPQTSFAVIGDVPYGAEQLAAFPGWVDDINTARPAFTVHVGDIKSGSTLCEDAYFDQIKAQFDRFDNPLIFTPGDNEWTDCHRATNGGHHPFERLDRLRSVFFPDPGTTLGANPMPVDSQHRAGFPENAQWQGAGISYAIVHIVGSNNNRDPWTGIGHSAPTTEQLAEERARTHNAITVIEDSFTRARDRGDRAVVIFMQADMFDPTVQEATPTGTDAFPPLIQAIVDQSAAYDGQVYLIDGDSHVFHVDRPLATGSPWLDVHQIRGSADNLTRITVDGSQNNTNWLRVEVNRRDAPHALSWQQVPYSGR